MNNTVSPLHSEYIIDGVHMETTPEYMIKECLPLDSPDKNTLSISKSPIVDESNTYIAQPATYDSDKLLDYLQECINNPRSEDYVSTLHPKSSSTRAAAKALIDSIWKQGVFQMENLAFNISWEWDTNKIGNLAAFYNSVDALTQYIFDLGLKISNFNFVETTGECRLKISTSIIENEDTELLSFFNEDDANMSKAIVRMEDGRYCPERAINIDDSTFVYIPFDTCPPRLGDSLLESVVGKSQGASPNIMDSAYFIDSFEVVRELVEDGVALSGDTTAHGGVISALESLRGDLGVVMDISNLQSSYMEEDLIKLLFTEIPGVILQIKNTDMDYVDSQLLLQEIAYYPIAYISKNTDLKVVCEKNSKINGILDSLLREQSYEG